MILLRCPNTGEHVLVASVVGYDDWEVVNPDLVPPPVDHVLDEATWTWVYSPQVEAHRLARRLITDPNALAEALADAGSQGDAGQGGGADPWTYIKLADDFTISTTAAGNIPGLAFTPVANTSYEFEAVLMMRTAVTTTGPRPGLTWPTGMVDGVVMIDAASSATARILANGNIAAEVVCNNTGLPNTTQSFPARFVGTAIAGANPSGNVQLRLRSEIAASAVTVKAGSFLKYRVLP
jgi:hypothetical protein